MCCEYQRTAHSIGMGLLMVVVSMIWTLWSLLSSAAPSVSSGCSAGGVSEQPVGTFSSLLSSSFMWSPEMVTDISWKTERGGLQRLVLLRIDSWEHSYLQSWASPELLSVGATFKGPFSAVERAESTNQSSVVRSPAPKRKGYLDVCVSSS